jgi:hemerythrin-like metal-binding protein
MSSNADKSSNWFYEALPYAYIGSGGLVALALPNLWGVFSGVLLISAGALVWNMRRRHRYLVRRRDAQRILNAARKAEAMRRGRYVQLVWQKEYECGNPLIDTQHRHLFTMGNTLLNAIMSDESKLDVELQFDELIEKIAQHFQTEETMMARGALPGAAVHKSAHARLLERSKSLAEHYHRDQLDAGDLFNFIAKDVLAQHILKDDRSALIQPPV